MTMPPPDGSRDRRIEDPSNRLLIHPLAQALVPWAIRVRLSANAVSIAGLALGIAAAAAFAQWRSPGFVMLGLVLAIGWLVADGLDGKVARATGGSSAFGRFLDGVCDHVVFVAIYVALAATIGTAEAWGLAVAAGAAHAVQSSLYEGERHRFHRRRRGEPFADAVAAPARRNPLVALYDVVAGSIDRVSRPFEAALATAPDPARFGARYARAATAPMRAMIPLSANTRVFAIAIACLAAHPTLFWWFELLPLTAVTAIGLGWHRRVELRFTSRRSAPTGERPHLTA